MLESVVTGVASSLVASSLFLFVLYKLRPKLEISPVIANQSKTDEPMFGIKVINKTGFALTNLEFQLTMITPKAVPNGVVLTNTLIPLTKDRIFEIGPYSKKDKDAHYALRIGAPTDIFAHCTNESHYLYLTVSAQHSLSGFSKVFTK
jgi:hypothetical protein